MKKFDMIEYINLSFMYPLIGLLTGFGAFFILFLITHKTWFCIAYGIFASAEVSMMLTLAHVSIRGK